MKIDPKTRTFGERDEFQRKSIAEKVIKLLGSDIDVSPMVIDGGWGTGKTEFCHKLINLYKEQADCPDLIYIDAFQADHADEPLLTVLAEVVKALPTAAKKKGFIKKSLPFLRHAGKVVGKAAVSHALRQDTESIAAGYDKEIQKITNKVIDASVESLLKDHVEASKNLESLQRALAEIAKTKPIVIFIDELDRCKPDFAVSMLETIKHVFDVDGVSFVLITNTIQLKAAINHCYGASVDAYRYLDKFLKFSFVLPDYVKTSMHDQIHASILHFPAIIDPLPKWIILR